MGISATQKQPETTNTGRYSEWYLSEGGMATDRLPAFTRHNDSDKLKLRNVIWDQGPIMQVWMVLMIINLLVIAIYMVN